MKGIQAKPDYDPFFVPLFGMGCKIKKAHNFPTAFPKMLLCRMCGFDIVFQSAQDLLTP